MAKYITEVNDKLMNMAYDLYGTLTDRSYLSTVINNPDAWDGQGIQLGGIEFDIPEPIFQPKYNPNTIPVPIELATNEELVYADVGETLNISGRDGTQITEIEAVEQDVIYRVLTYRGWREWRRLFGTRFIDALNYNLSDRLGEAALSAVQLALTPATERYVIRNTSYTIDIFEQILYVFIDVTPLFGTSEDMSVTIPLRIPDLT